MTFFDKAVGTDKTMVTCSKEYLDDLYNGYGSLLKENDILVDALSEIKAVSDNFGKELELIDGNKIPADNERIKEILEKCLMELKQSNDQSDES